LQRGFQFGQALQRQRRVRAGGRPGAGARTARRRTRGGYGECGSGEYGQESLARGHLHLHRGCDHDGNLGPPAWGATAEVLRSYSAVTAVTRRAD